MISYITDRFMHTIPLEWKSMIRNTHVSSPNMYLIMWLNKSHKFRKVKFQS